MDIAEEIADGLDEIRQEMVSSRRDRFAAAAMQALITARSSPANGTPNHDLIAKSAVRFADAMLAALEGETS